MQRLQVETMTQEEIIEMGKQSGIDLYALGKDRAKFVHYLERFAKLIEKHKLNEVAAACERLPFGDTAQSFAVWIRQQ
jgi:hypothetical protein